MIGPSGAAKGAITESSHKYFLGSLYWVAGMVFDVIVVHQVVQDGFILGLQGDGQHRTGWHKIVIK